MIKRCFLHSGNDQKSGKLSPGMGGRFHPESVATLFRNGWQVWTGICICILSPSYFNSKMCIQELVWAIENNVSLYPVLYRACKKGLKSSFSEESDSHVKILNEKSALIGERQYADFTKLRNKAKDSSEVLEFLDGICEQIE